MRRAAFLALLLGALAGPSLVAALTLPPTQEGVYVYDLAGIWQPSTKASAQSIAEAIRTRTQAQLAIVSWPSGLSSVETDTARADARVIMDTWGVGRAGVNDGLVVLFDMDDTLRHGQIYLFTGSGFRDLYLNDGEAAGVVNGTMLPLAKDGDLDGALLAGLADVDRAVQPGGNPGRLINSLIAVAIVAAGLIVFGVFLRTWWLRGRDARVVLIDDSVLLPDPPPGLTPALATILRKDEVDHDAFTSALVDLGHRGLLTFEPTQGDKHHVDLVVPPAPLVDPASLEARRRPLGSAEEVLALSVTAKAGHERLLSWKDLRGGEGEKLYDAYRKAAGAAAQASGWFRDDPNRLTDRWFGVGLGLAVAAVVLFLIFARGPDEDFLAPGREWLGLPLLVLLLLGVAIMLLRRFLAARTADGARTLAMALAYRNTLRHEIDAAPTIDQAVDRTKSKLPWITTPDLLTVWAVAFGLRHEIDHLIKETFETQEADGRAARAAGPVLWAPAWYGASGGSGNLGSIGDFSGMIGSISTTSASSSGGGYGGGGGGGGGGAGGGF